MGARSRLVGYLDANHAVHHLDRIATGRLVAHEAGTGGQVERPRVVRTGEVAAEDVALDQRIALVWTRVRDGVDVSVHTENGDLVTLVLDERPPVRVERVERNRKPVGHS